MNSNGQEDGPVREGESENRSSGSRGTGPELDRLPPPAFPPGMRRTVVHRSRSGDEAEGAPSEGLPSDAFISPDEPIRRIAEEFPDDAFISPDEPIRHRDPHSGETSESDEDEEWGDDDVMVTGIGIEIPTYAPRDPRRRGAAMDVHEIATSLERLAFGLRDRGALSLVAEKRMSSFESLLRGFIAGYLVGRDDDG